MKVFVVGIAILLLLPAVFAIKTVNVLGEDDDKFSTLEDVYIQGECLSAANLTVDVYIAEDQTSWTINNSIVDLANGPVRVQANGSGNISRTIIWAAPLDPGTYDVVVDVNGNKLHDDAMDCVDSKSKVGLTVAAPGSGHIISNYTEDRTWVLGSYANATMLQLNITASKKEKIDLKSFKLISFGLGDEKLIDKVFIAEDTNDNGVFNAGKDKTLGSANFSIDDDTVRVALSKQLDAGTSKTLFIVYEMGAVKEGGTFTVKLANITASGNNSEADIIFSNLPLTSGTTTVVAGEEIESTEETVSEENTTENKTDTQADVAETPQKWKKREKESGSKGIFIAIGAISFISLLIFFFIFTRNK